MFIMYQFQIASIQEQVETNQTQRLGLQLSMETTYMPDPTVPQNFTEISIGDGEMTHIDAGPYNGYLQGSLTIQVLC